MQPSEVFPVISLFRGIPAFAQASRNLDATLEKLPKNPTMSQKVVSILYDISRLVVIEFTFNRTRLSVLGCINSGEVLMWNELLVFKEVSFF